MRCAEVRENLVACLDGELPPETAEQIEIHVASCSDCRRERSALETSGDLLARLGAPRADLKARVLAAVRDETPPWCRHIRRELVAFVDGELGEKEAAPVVRHLEECGSCEAERRALVRTGSALGAWTLPPLSGGLAARLPGGHRRRRGRLLPRLRWIAAACLLAAAGVAGWYLERPAQPPKEVLQNIDLLQAYSQQLLEQDPSVLEMAQDLDWLESLSDDELALLSDPGTR